MTETDTETEAEIFSFPTQAEPPAQQSGLDKLFWLLTLVGWACAPAAVIAFWRWAL